jgi:hypothetical protein
VALFVQKSIGQAVPVSNCVNLFKESLEPEDKAYMLKDISKAI